MLKSLEASMGIVTTAAKKTGIDRVTHYRWMEKDPDYKQAVDDLQNVVLDFAETALYEMVQDHNPAATLFLLKTKGKKRGYIERQEIEHRSDTETDITFEVHKREKSSKD